MLFLDLPNEILVLIFRQALQLDWENNIRPMWLDLICHQIRSIVEPLLYEKIGFKINIRTTQNVHVDRLLRTVANRPALGSFIQQINVAGTWPGTFNILTTSLFKTTFYPHEVQLLAHRGAALDDGAGLQDWAKHLRAGLPDAYLVLLLSYCTRLSSLTPGSGLRSVERLGDWESDTYHVPSMEKAISRLTTLKSLHFEAMNPDLAMHNEPLSPIDVYTLFKLPQISSATVNVCEKFLQSMAWTYIQAPMLRTLHLNAYFMNVGLLSSIIGAFPNLVSLRISLIINANHFERPALKWFDCPKLSESLSKLSSKALLQSQHHSSSKLKELVIDGKFAEYMGSEGGPWGDGSHLWGIKGALCLKDLDKLENLQVDRQCLFGWHVKNALPLDDIIPRSLKTLKLTSELACYFLKQDYEWGVCGLRDYIIRHLDAFERCMLQRVVLDGEFFDLDHSEANVEELLSLFGNAGVGLQIKMWRPSDDGPSAVSHTATYVNFHLIVIGLQKSWRGQLRRHT